VPFILSDCSGKLREETKGRTTLTETEWKQCGLGRGPVPVSILC
jgi:hypothetical protein